MSIDRRRFLMGLAAGSVGLAWSPAHAAATGGPLLVIVLRGGLDGLAAVPAPGDPSFATARGAAGDVPMGPLLDDTFALHPSLASWQALWDDRDLLVAHGVGLPYARRSHFDAQDMLGSGLPQPMASETGWLGRAVHEAGGQGVAVGRAVPLLLRGPGGVRSVDPTRRSRRDEGRLEAVRASLAADPVLGTALEDALDMRATLDRLGGGRARDLADTLATTAKLMALPDGPRVASLELDGWDTHSRQGPVLEKLLAELAEGVVAFRDADPTLWKRAMVLVVTEFGRTVAGNGTDGTDHGVGGVAFALGGAVDGGRVLADWRGLGPDALVDGRDLPATTDLRALFAGALVSQLGLSEGRALDAFPGSGDLRPVGLT